MRRLNNLLITGGAGFIGSAFIRYLLQSDFKGTIVNIDSLTYAGSLNNLSSIENDPRYQFFHDDIRNQPRIEHLCDEYEIDAIIHFAAESHVDRSISNPKEFLETNILGTYHLLEVVKKKPTIHFHHISTDEVFGCLGEYGTFNENSPYQPNSPYSASKAAADHLVRAYATTYGISTCISNCSNNYGPYQHPEKLIPLIIRNCLANHPLPIYGNGQNIRDWLYVDDHAMAIWVLLQQSKPNETFTIGGNCEWRNIDLIHKIIDIIATLENTDPEKYRSNIIHVTDRAGHDYRYAVDSSKIENEIGWIPKYTFEKGLTTTIEWYLNHPGWIEASLAEEKVF